MAPKLLATVGRDDLARVYALQLGDDPRQVVETVDSVDPRYPRHEKAVIILSTQFGCPVACPMCDAGSAFFGNLTADQMLAQVQLVRARRPALLATRKLKVHFARMGEPALNAAAVLDALERLPDLLPTQSLMPCVASVAPAGTEPFFAALGGVKQRLYPEGRFQLQLSVNSTAPDVRRQLMPVPHLGLEALATLGETFYRPGDRKIALNFALARGVPVDAERLRAVFDPRCFMVKLTPVNPTERARRAGLDTVLSAEDPEAAQELVARLTGLGLDVVVSIGEADEIQIGSNCGQLVRARPWQEGAKSGAARQDALQWI